MPKIIDGLRASSCPLHVGTDVLLTGTGMDLITGLVPFFLPSLLLLIVAVEDELWTSSFKFGMDLLFIPLYKFVIVSMIEPSLCGHCDGSFIGLPFELSPAFVSLLIVRSLKYTINVNC